MTKTTSTGWSTSYYDIPQEAQQIQDLIELRGMNFSVGNIFKAAYRLGAKEGVDEVYDLNKIIWFAEREKARILNEQGGQLSFDFAGDEEEEFPYDNDEEDVDVPDVWGEAEMVHEFHKAFDLPVYFPDFITDEDVTTLRASLVMEEAGELEEAVEKYLDYPDSYNERHIIKEACDVLYVILGFMVSFGVDWSEAFRRVHESNMSKLGDDGKPVYRPDGKVIKGPNYISPDMSGLF